MKKLFLAVLACISLMPSLMKAQERVVLITVDGYRWQELFGGADSLLINTKKFGDVQLMNKKYWRATKEERRETLMPFTWNFIAKKGVIIGNRWKGCTMDVTNKMWFSYPGYNEDLCGYADDINIHSNGPVENPNVSILEVANNTPAYKNKVLAFGSWERFIQILNEKRSGLEVNAGYRHALTKNPTAREKYIDKLEDITPFYWGDERFDFLTHEYAVEAMKTRHPLFLYIAYGDTDDWAHEGNYNLYLDAARNTDAFIKELWDIAQSDPFYKDKTTFIITCDHGRGDVKLGDWCDHGSETAHSGQTWLMAFGKGIPAKGELTSGVYHNNQIAPTVASFLKVPFAPKHEGVGQKIKF